MTGRASILALGTSLCAALSVAACTGPGGPESLPPSSSAPPPEASTVGPPSAPTTPTAPAPPAELTLAFAGDVHFEGVLRDRLADPASALAPVTSALAAADVAVVNLETSVGAGGSPEPGKRFTFQAPPTALAALAAAGVDVATMANNHALDFGPEMLPSTFAAIADAAEGQPPLAVVGIGRDAGEAFGPAVTDVGGTSVATIGATVAATDPTADPTGHWAATATSPGTADAVDPRLLLQAVARAAESSDVVVVYVHWGIQGERCPSAGQRSLAVRLVERGADVVVGSHTHRLQADGRLGDGYVAYGLGNYAWYTPSPGDIADTGVLTLTVQPPESQEGRATVSDADWEPARIGTDGLPTPVTGEAARRFESERGRLRDCAGLATRPGHGGYGAARGAGLGTTARAPGGGRAAPGGGPDRGHRDGCLGGPADRRHP